MLRFAYDEKKPEKRVETNKRTYLNRRDSSFELPKSKDPPTDFEQLRRILTFAFLHSRTIINAGMRSWMGSGEDITHDETYEAMVFHDIIDIILKHIRENEPSLSHSSRELEKILQTVVSVDYETKDVCIFTGDPVLEYKIKMYVDTTTYRLCDTEYPKILKLSELTIANGLVL